MYERSGSRLANKQLKKAVEWLLSVENELELELEIIYAGRVLEF